MSSIGEIKSHFLKSLYKKFHASTMASTASSQMAELRVLIAIIVQDMIAHLALNDKCLVRRDVWIDNNSFGQTEIYQSLLSGLNQDKHLPTWSIMSLSSIKDVVVCFDGSDLIGLIFVDGPCELCYYCHPEYNHYIEASITAAFFKQNKEPS